MADSLGVLPRYPQRGYLGDASGDAWVGRSWWLGFTLLLLCKEQTEPFISVSCSQLRSLPSSCCSLSGEMRGGKDAAKLHFAPVLGTSFAVSAVF